MGISANHRGSRAGTNQDGLPVQTEVLPTATQKKWTNLMPLVVALVVFAEIAFLGRLDLAKNTALVDTWADMFYQSPPSTEALPGGDELKSGSIVLDEIGVFESCVDWLEKEDAVVYSRDFAKEPIFVSAEEKEWKSCAVGCEFGSNPSNKPDASFGLHGGPISIHRSMESAQYYSENNIAIARRWERL